MWYNGKKNALGTVVCLVASLLCSLASWLCCAKAKIEAMTSNEDSFAIGAVVFAILSYVLILAFLYFGAKMLKGINGRGVAFYVIVAIGMIFVILMLLLTIPSLSESIKLI